ncbi:hypothetical protein JTE90_012173 [Oedothorax gibbosus]|uniref:Uncharacterized protein n=1 Tax=Oedothorax gibbosus TaxID=931172 RepID=A0AAV6TE06_9ARAC|nr:hypothetical protein JTE90_012173 [Oedothorax gibbosus]
MAIVRLSRSNQHLSCGVSWIVSHRNALTGAFWFYPTDASFCFTKKWPGTGALSILSSSGLQSCKAAFSPTHLKFENSEIVSAAKASNHDRFNQIILEFNERQLS